MTAEDIDISTIWNNRFKQSTEVIAAIKAINEKFSSYNTFGELDADIDLKTNIANVIGYIRHTATIDAWKYLVPWCIQSLIPWKAVKNFPTHPVEHIKEQAGALEREDSIEFYKQPFDHQEAKNFINELSTNAQEIFSNSEQGRFYYRKYFSANIKGVSGAAYEVLRPTSIQGLLDRLHTDVQDFMNPPKKYASLNPLITGILFLVAGLLTMDWKHFNVGKTTGAISMILAMLICQISVASWVRFSYEFAIHARRVAINNTLAAVSQSLATFATFLGAFAFTQETPTGGKIFGMLLLIIIVFSTISTVHMNNIAEMINARPTYGSSSE